MKINELIRLIEKEIPLAYAEDFDNVGLLTGDGEEKLQGVLIAHDALEETVDEAIREQCNLIIAFHPILFSGIKRLTGADYVQRSLIKAIRNRIAVYAVHTALDNRIWGVSGLMARQMELQDVKILVPKAHTIKQLNVYVPQDAAPALRKALFDAGAGEIGNYSRCSFNTEGTGTYLPEEGAHPAVGTVGKWQETPEVSIHVVFERHLEAKVLQAMWEVHPYEEVAYEVITLDNFHPGIGLGVYGLLPEPMPVHAFLDRVKEIFDVPVIRHSAYREKHIQKVALLGGSGAFAIDRAKSVGADAFLTADLKYHDFFKAGKNMLLADTGHYESERFTNNFIYDFLTKKMFTFAPPENKMKIIISSVRTNPINYY